jgi:uncharacterized protein (TIGR02757 family)
MAPEKTLLEQVYRRYHHRRFVDPDPLVFLYRYPAAADREIAGLVAASLAYGRVQQIMSSVDRVLAVMEPGPRPYLEKASRHQIRRNLSGFIHRFADDQAMASLLWGIRGVIRRYGSIENAFQAFSESGGTSSILTPLAGLVGELHRFGSGGAGHLLARPERGSACKRLHLYLRWMVRRDKVDPGGWTQIEPSALMIPLDVHMFRISRELGFTRRRQADGKAVLETTAGFRRLVPDDPARYDFSLTRMGIRSTGELPAFFQALRRHRRSQSA